MRYFLTLSLVIVAFSAALVAFPNHSGEMLKVGYAASNGSTLPLLTNASTINSGLFSTRSWSTEKHVYSMSGVPSNGTLVEIQNAVLSSVYNGAASQDCNDSSDTPARPSGSWCDSVADANDGTGNVHVEIDQVYKYLGIAPADWPASGATVDIAGYTFYDGEGGGSPTNPVPGGWEIHPVTEWVLSGSSSRFILTVSSGSGGSTIPGPGSYSVASGSTVLVSASPLSSYSFTGFSVDGHVSMANPVTVTMNSNHAVSATFVTNGPLPSGQGSCLLCLRNPLNLEVLGASAFLTGLGLAFAKARMSNPRNKTPDLRDTG